jgi:hypothetical protein
MSGDFSTQGSAKLASWRGARMTWRGVAMTMLLFAAIGPVIGMMLVLLPMLPLLWLAGPMLIHAPVGAYGIGIIPAALTGVFTALVSPLMRPPAPVSFYLLTVSFGACACFVTEVLLFLRPGGPPSAPIGILAVVGAVTTAICVRIASGKTLGRRG